MPCYDPDSSHEAYGRRIDALRDELNKVETMLCAVINVLHKNRMIVPVVEQIDPKEAGVTANDIALWWRDHKVKDAMRKRDEKT